MAPSKEAVHSDYDTDTNNHQDLAIPVPGPRTTDELNLAVLRRQEPSITKIISIAPYVVLYQISVETSTWEKSGIEGTMFVAQLTNSEIGSTRFAVVILNRRSLENFIAELKSPEDVEITEDFVILNVPNKAGAEDAQFYGVWIFSEPAPSSTADARDNNARTIQDCARAAETSRLSMEQLNHDHSGSEAQEPPQSVPMGRQVSLRELFGQQREADADFSIHGHGAPPASSLPQPQARPAPAPAPAPMFAPTADTAFFHAAPTKSPAAYASMVPQAVPSQHIQVPPPQQVPVQQPSAPAADVMDREELLKLFTQRTNFGI
ncbi:hypothetical protein HDK77DRAFT_204636 [Phyllosticta capitalensis]|uniref:uncharacterized protein n=1 Tax=Phyllosticta capitalensis TaxID=121624 RepID=UPI0031328CCD